MPTDPFGFSENPFADRHDPRFLYRSRPHCEAVAHLRRALESREPFALLTGLPGVGKTVALEAAFAGSGPHTRVTIPASPALTREEFLECLLAGLAPGETGGIEARLRAVRAAGYAAVLVVEEAQDLAPPLLDDLRLYSNLEAGGHILLQIVLAGQPVLEETLSGPACDALRQRIGTGHRLDPLSAEETEGYVRYRVGVAGGDELSLFTSEACRALHRSAHGIPRELGRLANEALALARTAGEDRVTAGHVAAAVVLLGFRSAAGEAAVPEESTAEGPTLAEPAAEEPMAEAEGIIEAMETVPGADELPGLVEYFAPAEDAPALRDEPVAQPPEPEPVAQVEEAFTAEDGPAAAPAARLEETVPAVATPSRAFPVVEVDVTPQPAAPAPRHARRRREAAARARSPRTGHLPRAAALTAAALLVLVAGVLVGMNSTRGRQRPPSPARVAIATGDVEPAGAPTTGVSTARPSVAPVATPPRIAPAPPAAPAPAQAKPAAETPEPSYGVEVATFLSESRAQTERDRLAAVLQRPCRVVPSDEDGFAVVVGPVSGSKKATRLSVDLADRGLVNEARVVRWAASGGAGR